MEMSRDLFVYLCNARNYVLFGEDTADLPNFDLVEKDGKVVITNFRSNDCDLLQWHADYVTSQTGISVELESNVVYMAA